MAFLRPPIQENGIFETPYMKNGIFEAPYTNKFNKPKFHANPKRISPIPAECITYITPSKIGKEPPGGYL